MATKKSTDGVGKKIVEALKKQSGSIVEDTIEKTQEQSDTELEDIALEETQEEKFEDTIDSVLGFGGETAHQISPETKIDTSFLSTPFSEMEQPLPAPKPVSFTQEAELKTDNVKVLSNLINQLPPGISKETGAQIIKQTMEALGISMKTVLGEAQQIQERISMSSNECLNSIQEYKKQIQAMEKQVQVYHKQYNSLNELISLFVQTGI